MTALVERDLRAAVHAVHGHARRRARTVTALAAVGVGAALLVRVLLGDYQISLVDFVKILAGEQIPGATFIVMESKLPRATLGLLVGIALGVGGAIYQSVLRNPLASPDVIGISMGASASAVFAIVVLGLSGQPVALFAVVGALLIALAARMLGRGPVRGGSAEALVVTGVVIGALLLAVVQYLLTRASIYDAQAALVWLTGSLADASWPGTAWLAISLVLVLPVLAMLWPAAAALELGEESATTLGVGPRRQDVLLALATVCVAVGVAAAGPVAFVSFLAGPLSRGLLGGRLEPALAGMVGALLVLVGDFVGGELLWDLSLPVGVITGACGAPFLLAVLLRSGWTR